MDEHPWMIINESSSMDDHPWMIIHESSSMDDHGAHFMIGWLKWKP